MKARRRPTRHHGSEAAGLEAAVGRGATALRRQLLVGTVLAVLALLGLAALLAWRQYESAKRSELRELRARVVLAATVFDTYFAGQLSTLSAMAAAPALERGDGPAAQEYFSRLQPQQKKLFTGGIGWYDRRGTVLASTLGSSGPRVADRSFFRRVTTTGRPFVSEGLVGRITGQRLIVMAVPTRDASGRLTGVLAGALRLQQASSDDRAIDLGYEGLVVVDRAGQQITLASFARPRNKELLARLRKGEGVLAGTDGLSGSTDRVVAFANSKAIGWTTVIDRRQSEVFAAAHRSLLLELGSAGGAAVLALLLLSWSARRSRRGAEAERDSIRRWNALMLSFGSASSPSDVSKALAVALAESFRGVGVIVAVEDDEARGTLALSTARSRGVGHRVPLEGADGVARLAYVAGEPVAIEGEDAVRERWHGGIAPGVRSLYAVPLLAPGGRAIGSVTLVLVARPLPDDDELVLLSASVEHAGRALARTRVQEEEHDAAVMLQRSLLPEQLPAVEGLEIEGRYGAAGAGLEVGGDWYDVVRRPDGIVHLTVGDVAGRGVPAAALMGQIRHAFRAYAHEHASPGDIFRSLQRHMPEDSMATAVFVAIDPYVGRLTYASAGHPPVLLHDVASGAVTRLDDAGAPPLGWADERAVREATIDLPDAAVLVGYSDGLVERPGSPIDTGIDELAEALRAAPERGAGGIASTVMSRATRPGRADDTALLVVRLTGVVSRFEVDFPADPAMLAGLRRRLDRWLTRRGVAEADRVDTVLAVSEACNNAIEHAYGYERERVRVVVAHTGDSLQVTVEDRGAWRPVVGDTTRGRGFPIMNATMSAVRVEARDGGGTRVELERRLGGPGPQRLLPVR